MKEGEGEKVNYMLILKEGSGEKRERERDSKGRYEAARGEMEKGEKRDDRENREDGKELDEGGEGVREKW